MTSNLEVAYLEFERSRSQCCVCTSRSTKCCAYHEICTSRVHKALHFTHASFVDRGMGTAGALLMAAQAEPPTKRQTWPRNRTQPAVAASSVRPADPATGTARLCRCTFMSLSGGLPQASIARHRAQSQGRAPSPPASPCSLGVVYRRQRHLCNMGVCSPSP